MNLINVLLVKFGESMSHKSPVVDWVMNKETKKRNLEIIQ